MITTELISGDLLKVGDHFLNIYDGHYYEVTAAIPGSNEGFLIRDIQQQVYYVSEHTPIQRVIYDDVPGVTGIENG